MIKAEINSTGKCSLKLEGGADYCHGREYRTY